MNMLDAALLYTKWGWIVHPLSSPDDKGKSPGKKPLLKDWQKRNLATNEELQKWFVNTDYSIGLQCGVRSKVTVIDFDLKDLFPLLFPNGIDTMMSARIEGRGHVYLNFFDIPSFKNSELGIELLNDGANAVLPPSVHAEGQIYKWNRIDGKLAELDERGRQILKAIQRYPERKAALRPCFRWMIDNVKEWHGGSGRERMLALTTELKANGGDEFDACVLACRIYRGSFDAKTTIQEWRNVDPKKTWRCKTLQSKIPDIGHLCQECHYREREEKSYYDETSFFARAPDSDFDPNPWLYEQVINETGAQYCVYHVEKTSFGDKENIHYIEGTEHHHPIPASDPAIKEGAVILSERAEHYENLMKLIDEIKSHIHKYVDISPYFEQLAVWYILLSWVYDKVDVLPYLRFLGDSGTEKSRALDVIGGLCYKPIKASGAITPAPIYRLIRKWHGTLLIDEADFRDSDEKQEVIKILNCGFERDRPVIRSQMDNPDNIQILPTFSPKILTTRQRFEDQALESRCLTETMFQTTRDDIPYQLPKSFYEEQMTLRNKLLMFRFRNRNKIDTDKAQNLDLGDIEPRLKQATASFAVLFANIDGMFSEFKAFLDKYNRELKEERAQSYDGQILNAIFDIMKQSTVTDTTVTPVTTVTITPKDIAEKMKEKGGLDKLPNTAYIGRRLRALGLEVKMKKVEKEVKRCLIWDQKRMDVLKKRYVVDEVTAVTEVTEVTESVEDSKQSHIEAKATYPFIRCSICISSIKDMCEERPSGCPKGSSVKRDMPTPTPPAPSSTPTQVKPVDPCAFDAEFQRQQAEDTAERMRKFRESSS